MARPKLSENLRKEKLNLTVSPDVKEMAEYVRNSKNISISELVEECIRKEYRKLERAEKRV